MLAPPESGRSKGGESKAANEALEAFQAAESVGNRSGASFNIHRTATHLFMAGARYPVVANITAFLGQKTISFQSTLQVSAPPLVCFSFISIQGILVMQRRERTWDHVRGQKA